MFAAEFAQLRSGHGSTFRPVDGGADLFTHGVVGYGKYRDLVARAYYARGQALERLKKNDAAIEVYAELVGRDELAEFGESTEARARLQSLGGSL